MSNTSAAMTALNICFVDYVYPYACGNKRWAIIGILQKVFKMYTGMDIGMVCIPSELSYDKQVDADSSVIETCIAFTGVESTTLSQLSNQELVIAGPLYNYSRDFVMPVSLSDRETAVYSGWGFVNVLDWSVWLVLIGVIFIALGIQALMKYISVDASPSLDKETSAEIMSRSILSTIGYSRLYQGDSHIISRHLLSCCMAFFSVGIVSLYGSNLINFFYKDSDFYRYLPPTSAIGVHPALKDIISLETFGLFSGERQALRIINMMPGAVFYDNVVPVVTRTVGESFKNATTILRSLGGYQTIYEVFLAKQFINGISNATSIPVQDIMVSINREISSLRTSQTSLEFYLNDDLTTRWGNSPLAIKDIYGVFIILLFGYVASILFRIFFTKKTGLQELIMCRHCFLKEDKVTVSPDLEFKVEDLQIENNNVDIEPVVEEIELTEIEVSDFDLESVASK
jgi:hypothetical protein